MTKSILIDTENHVVFGVYENVEAAEKAADLAEVNTYLIDEESDLTTVSGPQLVKIHNNVPGVIPTNKFTDLATAQSRTWKALDAMKLGRIRRKKKPKESGRKPPVAAKKRSRMAGKKFRLLPGWREKKFHKASRRGKCFDIIIELTNRGKRQGAVEDYIVKCKGQDIPENQAMICLTKLIDLDQKLPTVEMVLK